MLTHRPTTFLAVLLLASIFARVPVFGGTLDKARILEELVSTPAKASAQAKSNPTDMKELTLDLITYRWAVEAYDVPNDFENADAIISAAASSLSDSFINWAREAFSNGHNSGVSAIPAADTRASELAEMKRQLGMALDYRDASPLQSVNALTSALTTTRELHLDLTEALVSVILGRQYHYDMSRYRLAEECYSRAGLIFSAYNCLEAAAVVYDDYGKLGTEMSRSLVAAQYYTLAARQWSQLAKQKPGESRYRLMAGREYIRAGQAQSASGDSEKALELVNAGLDKLREAAAMTKSYDELIKNLITVSDIYRSQNNLPKAIELLRAAVRAGEYSEDSLLVAQVYDHLSSAYNATNLAVNAMQESARRDKVLTDASAAGESALVKLQTDTKLLKEQQEKLYTAAERGAAAMMQLNKPTQSCELLQKLLVVYRQSSLVDNQIRVMRTLAKTFNEQQKSAEALAQRMEAATLALKTNKKVLAAEIMREMVQSFIDVGDLDNALDMLAEFWSIMEQSGNVRGAADILEGRGTLLASHGRYEPAIQDFEKALSRYSAQIGDPWAAAGVSLKLASALGSLDRPAEAAAVLEKDLKEIETRYSDENVDPNTSPERARLMMGLYQELVTAYIRDNNEEAAKGLMSKARHYSWVSELLGRLKNSTAAEVAQFAKSVDIMGGDDGESDEDLRPSTILSDNWPDFSSRCATLRERHPAQYNALPINPLFELYKARNSLPKKALIVEYLLTNYAAYAFVCTNTKASVWELGVSGKRLISLTSKLKDRIKACEQSLIAGVPLPPINDWREPAFLEFREPLAELYKALIEPISKEFGSSQTLMFALPDELKGVPIHALISNEHGVPRFMVQDHQIGYLAEGMLNDLISRDSRPIEQNSDRLAVFGDPAGDLPGARKEANMLGKLYFNSSVYVGQRATVANFIKECDKASILHLAIHYNIDPNPSKFVLNFSSEAGSSGALTMQELSKISNPHLQLVALSACDSAASADPLESGPSRAAEVFSLVGAKSVLGGIWKVADSSATLLIGDFYRALVRGNTRTGSLQAAQIKMIDEKTYAHPFYWSCFAMYGSPW